MAKQDLDKYYTPCLFVEQCVNYIKDNITNTKDVVFIEPSAGDGRFYKKIKNIFGEDSIVHCFDLLPEFEGCEEKDFMLVTEDDITGDGCKIFIGNPPYGKSSGTAIKFFNKMDDLGADVIAMVLPDNFGVKLSARKRLSKNFSLYDKILMPDNMHFEFSEFSTNKMSYRDKVNRLKCSFQVWVRHPRNDIEVLEPTGYTLVRPPNKKVYDEEGKSSEQGVGHLDVDFSIITHGTRSGEVLDFKPDHKVSVKQFVKVDTLFCKGIIRDIFESTDYSYFKGAEFTKGQSSLSSQEIIQSVEKRVDKLTKLIDNGFNLKTYISTKGE